MIYSIISFSSKHWGLSPHDLSRQQGLAHHAQFCFVVGEMKWAIPRDLKYSIYPITIRMI